VKRRMTKQERRENRAGLLFVAPQVLGYLAFVAFPLLFSIYLCFAKWDLINMPQYVGLTNINALFRDRIFWKSILNTLIYIAIVVPATLICSLTLAILTNRKLPFMKFYRGALFLPMVTSTVAIAMVWSFIYQPNGGILNTILGKFGVTNPPGWLVDTKWARFAVSLVGIWLKVGYYYIIFDAGLKNIPEELYEAAKIDGAGFWRTTFSVTLPMMKGTTNVLIILGIVGSLKTFDLVKLLTGGGPGRSTTVMNTYLYEKAFNDFNAGGAASIGVAILIIAMIMSFLQVKLGKED